LEESKIYMDIFLLFGIYPKKELSLNCEMVYYH